MRPLGWVGIVRLGLVQAALGAVVVLATSTLNRVMVVELALPAVLPGALVALHYAVQMLRPRMGFGSDMGGRRTPWIVGGMAALALGGVGAASGVALMRTEFLPGLLLAIAAFVLVGAGVGAAGTSLLTLVAARTDARRRAPAATVLWLMMIAGIAVTSGVASAMLDPFSPARLVRVVGVIAGVAFLVSALAVLGMEGEAVAAPPAEKPRFMPALREIWAEAQARRFAVFVFVAMLAYGASEVVLEPFAGAVFHLTPGETAGLTGLQHGGVLAGMLLVALGSAFAGAFRMRAMRVATVGGCAASALALGAMAAAALVGPAWPLRLSVVALGAANGAFAVSAIGAMMGLAGAGRGAREGTRVGLWGAAQALAFGAGGLFGTGLIDVTHLLFAAPALAYAAVFTAQAAVFVWAAQLAMGVFGPARLVAPFGAIGLREKRA
jgi:BCD family chlorophyll transporter-like MFS transporter